MIESGIINYGDKFLKSMEKGEWDLSGLTKSLLDSTTFVFGQMNNLLVQELELLFLV